MNTILNLYIRERNLEVRKAPWKNFHYYSKNLEFRKPPGFLEFGKFKFPMKILYLEQKFDYPHAKNHWKRS